MLDDTFLGGESDEMGYSWDRNEPEFDVKNAKLLYRRLEEARHKLCTTITLEVDDGQIAEELCTIVNAEFDIIAGELTKRIKQHQQDQLIHLIIIVILLTVFIISALFSFYVYWQWH